MPRFKNLSLTAQVQCFVEKEKLLFSGQKVLCAVSGGLDSMVLAHILLELKYEPTVAHFNFGLREEASDLDEELVKNWAHKNDVAFFRKAVSKDHFVGKSIQDEARNLRYDWFHELAIQQNIKAIALAHHADDQIETIFLQMFRGTGLAGMRGMLPKKSFLIRPLLFAHKHDLKAFAEEKNVPWREDTSNEKTDYKRNKIRHLLIPLVQEISPGFENVILRNAERISLHEEVSIAHFFQLEKEFLERNSAENQEFSWGRIKASLSGRFFWMEFLRAHQFNFSILDEIWDAEFSSECRQWTNSSGQIIEIKADSLLFWFKPFAFNRISISGPGVYQIEENRYLEIKLIENKSVDSFINSPNEIFVDFLKINFPCKIIPWEAGDYVATLGLKGKNKKVSNLLTDRKLSLEAKKRVLKLEDSNGKIVWLLGIEDSFKFKIGKETRKIARLFISEAAGS